MSSSRYLGENIGQNLSAVNIVKMNFKTKTRATAISLQKKTFQTVSLSSIVNVAPYTYTYLLTAQKTFLYELLFQDVKKAYGLFIRYIGILQDSETMDQ